jgi:hypothetical protein
MRMNLRELPGGTIFSSLGAVLLAVLFGLLLSEGTTDGTTFRQLSLGELAAAAEAVVRVRCLSSESRWEGGEIWTLTQFEVVENLKGNAPRLLAVRTLGGRVGHVHSFVEGAPAFRAGEEAFLFLVARRPDSFGVLGWAQGTFRIRADASTGRERVTQDSAGFAAADPTAGKLPRKGIRNLPVEEFRRKVAEAAEPFSRRP